MDIAARLQELGLWLPLAPSSLGAYVPARRHGDLVFTAGQLPLAEGRLKAEGLLGSDVSVEEGAQCARLAALNGLAAGCAAAGGTDRLTGVLKVTGFVACVRGFADQPAVLNGASELLLEVFGEPGRHARSAVGVASLPMGAPVEVEFVFTCAGQAESSPPSQSA